MILFLVFKALYGLIEVQENMGDWLGYLSFAQANAVVIFVICITYSKLSFNFTIISSTIYNVHQKKVRGSLRAALSNIRPNAVTLVDAFEFPDNVTQTICRFVF